MINKNDKQKQEAIKWLSNEIENIPNYISNNTESSNRSNNSSLISKDDPMTKSNIVAPPLCEIS